MDVEFFLALLVLEPDFVEVLGSALLAAPALKPALSLILGQPVGRNLVGVVNPTGDDRTIGIALEKLNNDLLPDARNVDSAPLFPCPILRDANPAGGVFIRFVVAVPMKMHFH